MASAVAASCSVSSLVAARPVAAATRRTAVRSVVPVARRQMVVCSAEKKPVAKVAAAIASASALVAAHPALALVDERLSTEGTGIGLGISSPSVAWVLVLAFTGVWALFYTSNQPDGDDNQGLGL